MKKMFGIFLFVLLVLLAVSFASGVFAAGIVPATINLAKPELFYGVKSVENVPLPVVVNSYIVMHNGNNNSKDPPDCEIWLEMLTGDSKSPKHRGVKKLSLNIPPTYSVNYYLDAAWHLSYTDETATAIPII